MDKTTCPVCGDCGDPATEQVHTGTRITPGPPARRYAWMCEPCAREWQRFIERSKRQ